MTQLPLQYKAAGFRIIGSMTGPVERLYREFVQNKYKTFEAINKRYDTEIVSYAGLRGPSERLYERGFTYDNNLMVQEYLEFKNQLSNNYLYPVLMEGNFQLFLIRKYDKIADFNKRYKTGYKYFNEVTLPETLNETNIKEDWEIFVKTKVPLIYLTLDKKGNDLYCKFLERKYKKIEKLNLIYFSKKTDEKYKSFKQLQLQGNYEKETNNKIFTDVLELLKDKETAFPSEYLKIKTSELKFREFAKNKYKNISEYNKIYGSGYTSFEEIRIACELNDWLDMKANKGKIRLNFITRNYKEVSEYILLHGRAVFNTALFCLIIIFTTLTVNPMCAYALSRFTLSYSNKVLIFLLATMAFPAEVAMIPNFLMLKKLHLLNTYWALVLPGLASGYSIFILKGFFDSLPKEFYEAAQMDGAGEMRIFWNITLPLAKPILAYLSLGAFVGAYTAFMFALLVCQDPNMWTLMVWLYEMQIWASPSLLMAALVTTAIPTLLVFLFAQRVIMRGVIIPVQH